MRQAEASIHKKWKTVFFSSLLRPGIIFCLQSFGFEHMLTFYNLKRLGLLVEKEPTTSHATKNLNKLAAVAIPKSSNFRALCKKLHLVRFSERINLTPLSSWRMICHTKYFQKPFSFAKQCCWHMKNNK